MKTNNANRLSIYETLKHHRQKLRTGSQELERLRQLEGFNGRVSIRSVELAVKETRAWTLIEILDVLHQREESEWKRGSGGGVAASNEANPIASHVNPKGPSK